MSASVRKGQKKKKTFCDFLCFGSPMDFWALAFERKKILNMVFRYLMEKIQKLKYTFTPPKKIKIKSEHLFKKKQTNMAFCYLIEKIQKLF